MFPNNNKYFKIINVKTRPKIILKLIAPSAWVVIDEIVESIYNSNIDSSIYQLFYICFG